MHKEKTVDEKNCLTNHHNSIYMPHDASSCAFTLYSFATITSAFSVVLSIRLSKEQNLH
jgi:hypothetical protein